MHSLVIVVGHDWEKELAPFDQDLEPPSEHLHFVDTTDNGQLEYDTGSASMLVLADGTRLHMASSEARQHLQRLTGVERKTGWQKLKRSFKLVFGVNDPLQGIEPPPGAAICDVPFRDHYPSFPDFMREWHGDEPSPETGRYGYWENPKGRWDWYQMGGRWTGLLIAKPGRGGLVGQPGLLCTPPEPGHFDQMRKGDVDFEAMDAAHAGARNGAAWVPAAILLHGHWHDGDEDQTWGIRARELILSLPDDSTITVVDCHS